MILSIGSLAAAQRAKRLTRAGFTFMEVMVALVVFSVGAVTVLKSLLVSLDRMTYLTHRLQATTLLDNQLKLTERMLKVYQTLPMASTKNHLVRAGAKDLTLVQQTRITAVDDFMDTFELGLSVSWQEQGRPVTMTRTKYISDFRADEP